MEKTEHVIKLSFQQLREALADYCGHHSLVPVGQYWTRVSIDKEGNATIRFETL